MDPKTPGLPLDHHDDFRPTHRILTIGQKSTNISNHINFLGKIVNVTHTNFLLEL